MFGQAIITGENREKSIDNICPPKGLWPQNEKEKFSLRKGESRREKGGAHGFLAPFQTVDKQRHHKTDEHLKDHSKNSELDGVENGLLEIRVAQQLCIVLKGDKMRPFLQAAEKVVVGKAVNQRKEQRIRRHDQQDHNGRGQHSQTKPFGLGICGAKFGIYVSFHDSGLTFQKRYGS